MCLLAGGPEVGIIVFQGHSDDGEEDADHPDDGEGDTGPGPGHIVVIA